MPAGGEPGHVPDVAEQAGRAGRADPVQLEQRAPGRLDQPVQLLARRLDLPVDPVELDDELGGQLAARPAHDVTRAHGREQRLGLVADRNVFAPPGISSTSSRCSRFTVNVRAAPSSSRRSASSRSATVASSTCTARRPGVRCATTATEWASVASVLRPCPVENTRARADSLAGTSTTGSPWRPAAAPGAGPRPHIPQQPRPGPATAGPRQAAAGSRRGRCRTARS